MYTMMPIVRPAYHRGSLNRFFLFSRNNVLLDQKQQITIKNLQSRGMASKKHRAVLRQSKGFRGRANRCFTLAIGRLEKSWQYAYRDRKVKKRDMRRLWIERINAGVRQHGLSYSVFMNKWRKSGVFDVDRKIMADLAMNEPFSFKALVDVIKMKTSAAP